MPAKPGTTSKTSTPAFPEFRKPPVIEVASSIQFEPIDALEPARLGLLWAEYRSRYPRVERHSPLSAIVENYEAIPEPAMHVTLSQVPPPNRYWFLNEAGTHLIQVQHDRFILNWRKLDADETYPRYESLRELLAKELEVFRGFLRRELAVDIFPTQAELTYVNHMPCVSDAGGRRPLQNFLRLWRGEPAEANLPNPDGAGFQCRYTMGSQDGRLYIEVEPRVRVSDGVPIYLLQLIARGAPTGTGADGAFGFLDKGHTWIVNTFTALTTPEMHAEWERVR